MRTTRKQIVEQFEKSMPRISEAAIRLAFLTILLLMVLYRTFFQVYWVPSGSMIPTLSVGEIVFSQHIHDPSQLQRGDIVSFNHESGDVFIKRLVAMPEDTVEIKNGVLYINDKPQSEPYLNEDGPTPDYGPIQVPDGYYFMMGDNRNYSSDSRVIGPVAYQAIRSKALFHYPSLLRGIRQ